MNAKKVVSGLTIFEVNFETGTVIKLKEHYNDKNGCTKVVRKEVKPHTKKWYEMRAVARGIE